jgi:nucleoside-diphosphate-sugar epimerase
VKTLIIGGSGFIGTHLTEALLASGHEVTILDKAPSARFSELVILADVRDLDAVRSAMDGVDAVYLLAAEHRDDVRPSSLYYDVNVGGAKNTARAAVERGVRRIVFTSTVAVYGLGKGEKDESTPPAPFNDYGQSKLDAETVLKEWAEEAPDRSLALIRPTVVFGERNKGNVYNLIRQIGGRRFVMVGDGTNRKSMCYVGNLVPFLIDALKDRPGVRVCNYADKPDLDMNALVAVIRGELLNRADLPLRMPYWVGLAGGYFFDGLSWFARRPFSISSIRVRKFCADTRVAMRGPGAQEHRAPFTLEEGLRRMIRTMNAS